MPEITEAQYAAAIPPCCSRRTLEAHRAMMLCLGLCAALRKGEAMDCTGCELRFDAPHKA